MAKKEKKRKLIVHKTQHEAPRTPQKMEMLWKGTSDPVPHVVRVLLIM